MEASPSARRGASWGRRESGVTIQMMAAAGAGKGRRARPDPRQRRRARPKGGLWRAAAAPASSSSGPLSRRPPTRKAGPPPDFSPLWPSRRWWSEAGADFERHLGEARPPPAKTLDALDFGAAPMISKARVQALAAGDARIEKGWRVLFTGTNHLVQKLQIARRDLGPRGGDRQARQISPVDPRRPCLSEPRASTATSRSAPSGREHRRNTDKSVDRAYHDKRPIDKRHPARHARAASTSIMFTAGLLQPFKMRGHEQGYVTKIEAEGIPYLIQIDATHMSMELLAPFSKIEDEKAPPRQSRQLRLFSLRGLKSRNCRGPVSQESKLREQRASEESRGNRNCRSRASWKSKLWERRASAIPQQPWKKVHGG